MLRLKLLDMQSCLRAEFMGRVALCKRMPSALCLTGYGMILVKNLLPALLHLAMALSKYAKHANAAALQSESRAMRSDGSGSARLNDVALSALALT